jgi:hypothetical protein
MLQRISDLCLTIKSLRLGQAPSGPSVARDRRERLGQLVQKVEANVVDPGSVSRQHITPILCRRETEERIRFCVLTLSTLELQNVPVLSGWGTPAN